MIIEGEKYACEACVRGHRVSNCQHYGLDANLAWVRADRPLQHINKKGRPVSQCQHCRAMRKSRSSHVKCDCGEKPSKCAHLQPTVEGHTETCCCNHGGRCTCLQKKESGLGPVRESDSEHESKPRAVPTKAKAPTRRRRANTVHTDGILSFDQNGNAKQKVKQNCASQQIGPYQLNRANSANSASGLVAGGEDAGYTAGAEGVVDEGMAGRSQRRVKSEATSPLMSGASFPSLNGVTPLDLSGTDYQSYTGTDAFSLYSAGVESDFDAPMFSAGLTRTPLDWSSFNVKKEECGTFAPSSYSQIGTHGYNDGFSGTWDYSSASDHLPNLTNTTTTSGEVSEVEDFAPGNDGDYDGFAQAFGQPGQGMLGTATDLSSIDYDSFYKPGDNASMAGCGASMVEDDPAFWMPNYNERVSAMDDGADALGQSSIPGWAV
ncbi:hypothetical protein S40293_00725 [Stachybotrys chartarum IBT 40293]|nr:hypothetical protein S40293_00725 [Stachybotrys chartarum IBT 40293]